MTGSMATECRVAADHRPGMDRGLYIAASGMLAEQIRQDQIANDLANASTPGYKADRTSQRTFSDLLLQNSATGATIGPQSTAVQVDQITTDFSAEPVKDTGEPLDFAIVGDGFFAVQTDAGHALHAQRPVRARHAGPARDATRATRCSTRNGRAITATNGTVDPRRIGVVGAQEPGQAGRLPRHRHPRRRRPAGTVRVRRARGLRRRRRALDGGHDRLDAGLRGRPEGHPDHRRHARQGRQPGRLDRI